MAGIRKEKFVPWTLSVTLFDDVLAQFWSTDIQHRMRTGIIMNKLEKNNISS
jgi:hypothetical protein